MTTPMAAQEPAETPAPEAQAPAKQPSVRQSGAGGGLAPYQSERRIQVLALTSLVAAVGLNALLVGFDDARLFGLTIPGTVVLGLLAAPLFLGAVAVVRRSLPLLAGTIGILTITALLERPWEVEAAGLFLALLFGMSTLAFGELVHMTLRYEKLHEAVEKAGTGTESLDHAVSEYLKTFAFVFSLTIALGGAVGLLFTTLREFGPAQHRASFDYTSVYGLVGAAAILFTALLLAALARGADFSLPRRNRQSRNDAFERPDLDDLDEVDALERS